jgi:electron transfer flavoprotein alpha subunit
MPFCIWVVAEGDSRGVRDCTLEALGEARALADGLAGRVHAVLVGSDVSQQIEPVKQQDVDAIYRLEHPLLTSQHAGAWLAALASFLAQPAPGLVLVSATALGRELAPRLSARLGSPLVTDCVWIKPGPGRDIRLMRASYNGQFLITYSFPASGCLVASLRPGVVGIAPPIRCRRPEIITWKPEISDEPMLVRQIELMPGDPRTIRLDEAERIVAGGRGVKDRAAWKMIEDVADALDAPVGGSRAAMDLGFVARSRMIGQTGISVKPRLYLAAGISGVTHHLAGVEAEHLIAINTDRNAGIFQKAALGIVGDLHQILPRLAEKIRALRGKEGARRP